MRETKQNKVEFNASFFRFVFNSLFFFFIVFWKRFAQIARESVHKNKKKKPIEFNVSLFPRVKTRWVSCQLAALYISKLTDNG